jgi:hypothetical protein
MSAPARVLIQRYRCPEAFLNLTLTSQLSADVGFFGFGPGTTCYGRSSAGYRRPGFEPHLYDVSKDAVSNISKVCLPFDPTEIVENLRQERYPAARDSKIRARAKGAYYLLRSVLHPSVRKQVQRLQLRGWRRRPFPSWPVDRTVENICEQLLLLVLKATGVDRIPFIWFWPEGASSCLVMTHDVESEAGRNSCVNLMDIDDSFGIKASFQIVPEHRYSVSSQFLAKIRDRGFEINIQDLNHDGRLFNERKEFLRRATLINKYARAYGAKGFRAAVLYRKPEWYDAFEFSFDMSIPNTAHLDPQRGGCCTVMPYFIGDILELPVTTTQDYMLFHLLDERSIELWKEQIELILDKNGFVSFIVHPDYVMRDEVSSIYKDLLNYLRELQAARDIWVTLPSEVDRWWRARSKMQLVPSGNEWRIEGEDAERAVVAYARNADGELVYEVGPAIDRVRSSFRNRTE